MANMYKQPKLRGTAEVDDAGVIHSAPKLSDQDQPFQGRGGGGGSNGQAPAPVLRLHEILLCSADRDLFAPDVPSVMHLCSFMASKAAEGSFPTDDERDMIDWVTTKLNETSVLEMDQYYRGDSVTRTYDKAIPDAIQDVLEKAWIDNRRNYTRMVHRFLIVQRADVTKQPLLDLIIFLADWLKHYDGLAVLPSFMKPYNPDEELTADVFIDRGVGLYVHHLGRAKANIDAGKCRLGGTIHGGALPLAAGAGQADFVVPLTADTFVNAERFFSIGEKLRWANWPTENNAAEVAHLTYTPLPNGRGIYARATPAWAQLVLNQEVFVERPRALALAQAPIGTETTCVDYIFNLADQSRRAPIAGPGVEPKVLDEDCAGLLQVAVVRVAPQEVLEWEAHESMTQSIRIEHGIGQLYTASSKLGKRTASHVISAGNAVTIPRGTWHSMRNASSTEMLCLSTYYAKNATDKWEHHL